MALEDLCGERDDSLESIHLSKLAHVEDPELYRIALGMGGDPLGNYETLGGTFRKQASGRLENASEGASRGMNVGVLGSLLGGAVIGAKNKGVFSNASRLGGAAQGLVAGSMVAPVGAVAGSLIGGIIGALLPVGEVAPTAQKSGAPEQLQKAAFRKTAFGTPMFQAPGAGGNSTPSTPSITGSTGQSAGGQ